MSNEVEIMGAYFPGWLLATLLGIVLTACTQVFFAKVGIHHVLVAPVLVYLSLAFLWSGALWWLIFG